MITFVRTTGGSDINMAFISEAVEGEDGLVTLFLHDGEIRHATKIDWSFSLRNNGEEIFVAAPGTFALRKTRDEIPEVFREPVIAWLINRFYYPQPITIAGIIGDDIYHPTIMTPDGAVQNAYSQFPDYETWLKSFVRNPGEIPDEDIGLNRVYHAKTGRARLARDLDPFY